MTSQTMKVPVPIALKFSLEGVRISLQVIGEGRDVLIIVEHFGRVCPQGKYRCADSQWFARRIPDNPPVRINPLHANGSGVTLTLMKVLLGNLQVPESSQHTRSEHYDDHPDQIGSHRHHRSTTLSSVFGARISSSFFASSFRRV